MDCVLKSVVSLYRQFTARTFILYLDLVDNKYFGYHTQCCLVKKVLALWTSELCQRLQQKVQTQLTRGFICSKAVVRMVMLYQGHCMLVYWEVCSESIKSVMRLLHLESHSVAKSNTNPMIFTNPQVCLVLLLSVLPSVDLRRQ